MPSGSLVSAPPNPTGASASDASAVLAPIPEAWADAKVISLPALFVDPVAALCAQDAREALSLAWLTTIGRYRQTQSHSGNEATRAAVLMALQADPVGPRLLQWLGVWAGRKSALRVHPATVGAHALLDPLLESLRPAPPAPAIRVGSVPHLLADTRLSPTSLQLRIAALADGISLGMTRAFWGDLREATYMDAFVGAIGWGVVHLDAEAIALWPTPAVERWHALWRRLDMHPLWPPRAPRHHEDARHAIERELLRRTTQGSDGSAGGSASRSRTGRRL